MIINYILKRNLNKKAKEIKDANGGSIGDWHIALITLWDKATPREREIIAKTMAMPYKTTLTKLHLYESDYHDVMQMYVDRLRVKYITPDAEKDAKRFKRWEKTLNRYGIPTRLANNQLASNATILDNIAIKWCGLSDIKKRLIAIQAATVEHYNMFVAMMDERNHGGAYND